MRLQKSIGALSAVLLGARKVRAIELDVESPDSIKSAAATVAYGMVSYYTGNNTGDVPGNLPSPYYWWEAGAMFGALIDYWYYTGDDSYNKITSQAMLFQVGTDENYMPDNQTKTEGNDDQGFWGMAAMSAAEVNFPNPPANQPQWLALAQAVFNTQAPRWDAADCGGGLRWQIFPLNNGYEYKNSISNGCFFNLGARLAKYTGNTTYSDWAEKTWNWIEKIGLMNSTTYAVYDGADISAACTDTNKIQWSYNAGVYLLGAATMWNSTGSDQWKTRTQGIIDSLDSFFKSDIMWESACEGAGTCNNDQRSFKAYLSRWMAATTKVAPWTEDQLLPRLKTSATAAAKICTGGADGQQCGMRWYTGSFDGSLGVGEQMSALEVIQGTLIQNVEGPLSNKTGGTSQGDSSAGLSGNGDTYGVTYPPITTGDKAGAGILTLLIIAGMLGGAWWLIVGE